MMIKIKLNEIELAIVDEILSMSEDRLGKIIYPNKYIRPHINLIKNHIVDTNEHIDDFREFLMNYFQYEGIGLNDQLNEKGLILESLIDKLFI